jgi:hypothetical protein
MKSVPCAYFRVSLRDCAMHSSRWVDFAGFGSVRFRFFVQLVKMVRAFINETTARLRCVWVFVKLRSVAYVSTLPHIAIMCHRWERIQGYFSLTHWGICLLKMCIFYSLDRRSDKISRVRESGLREHAAMRVAHGDPMVARWDAIWVNKCAEKKRALFNHLFRS